MVCNATSYSILVISVYISFIDGGKPLTCYMSLTNFITYCCIGYKSKKWLDSKWWQKFIQIGPVMTGRIYLKIFTADDWCKWLQKFTWPYLGCWAKKKRIVLTIHLFDTATFFLAPKLDLDFHRQMSCSMIWVIVGLYWLNCDQFIKHSFYTTWLFPVL